MKQYWKEFVIVALITSLLFALGWQTYRLGQARNDYTALVNEFDSYKLAAQAEVQREQQRRIDELEGVKRNAQKLIDGIQAEFNSANANVNSLQHELARIREFSSAGTATNSEAATTYIGVLTELLSECSEKYASVAGQADRNRAAGLACEASYDAVSGMDRPK